MRRSSSEPKTLLQSTPDFPEATFLFSSGELAGTSPDAAINLDDSRTTRKFIQRRSALPFSTPAQVASFWARTGLSRTSSEQNDTLIDCRTTRPRSRSFGDTTTVELPVLTLPALRAIGPPQVEDEFHQDDGEMASKTVQSEQATSFSTTTGEAGDHHPPQTANGMCVVCLTECQETLGAAWLHPEEKETIDESDTPCTVTACRPCLKTYFEGIVAGGFDGSCPRMRCMCCPRVVCEAVWAPLVSPKVVGKFKRRADTLLSIQCGNCDQRGSVMVIPPPDRPYSATLASSMAALVGLLRQHQGKTESTEDNNRNPSSIEASKIRSAKTQAFCLALRRYASGQDVDVATFYRDVESLICAGLDGEDEYDVRYPRMVNVLRCVEDSERRASLHLRYFHFYPIVKTKCCNSEHCFRCRIEGKHSGLTCEQFEASWGHVDVNSCPACGISLTKGDGCNDIVCVCGAHLDWNDFMRERWEQGVSVLRIAYPDDIAREVVRIIRAGPPTADDEVGSFPVAAEREVNEESRQEQPPVEPERNPVQETPIPERGSAEEYRLANMFQDLLPGVVDDMRATIFAEELPQFTLLHAMSLLCLRPTPSQVYPRTLDYFGRGGISLSCETTDDDREWQECSAYSWLQHNQAEDREFRRRATNAQLLLVEAFFGNDDDDDVNSDGTHYVIAHVAAEHSRAALRIARVEQPEQSLFSWLGIPDYSAEDTKETGVFEISPGWFSEWEAPFANAEIEEDELPPLPPPIVLWGPQPPQGYAVPRAVFNPGPVSRNVSTVSCFGSMSLTWSVTQWLASSTSRQRRLRNLMGREEDRLSKAWIALWGRTQHQSTEHSELEKSPTVLNEKKVTAAARRCAFLEAYPEHACAEQSSMMKAFMRRNYPAVEIARAEANAQRASAWEEIVARQERGGDASPVSFRRTYTAYLSRVEKAAGAGYVPDGMKYPPSPKNKGIKRDKTAKATESDSRWRGRRGKEAFRERMFDCLATAWGKQNRQRVAAQRFDDAHDTSDSVALVAVTALVLVPILMEKTELMCHCDINPVERDAEDWKALNRAEFDKALEGVNTRLEAGIRVLEGCECTSEENIIICSRQVACPLITRRLLGVPNPLCCSSSECFHGGIEGSFLADLFQ